MSENITILFAPLTAFLAAYMIIPVIIRTATEKSLFDVPDGRKKHSHPIPPLGGIAIFIGLVCSLIFSSSVEGAFETRFIMLAAVFFFFVGLKDDLSEISASHKFFIQLFMTGMIAFGGLRVTSLHGLFGVDILPVPLQYVATILFIVGITNAYNLIDGIDGLSGGIGLIASLIFAFIFYTLDQPVFTLLSLSLAGALFGFLQFNFSPAKIFMGDTGSLLVGLLLGVMGTRFLQATEVLSGFSSIGSYAPVILLGILIVPVTDVTQVFMSRLSKGRSPFSPDRGHLHHMLLRLGLSHKSASIALYGATIGLTGLIAGFISLGISESITLLTVVLIALGGVAHLHIYAAEDQTARHRITRVILKNMYNQVGVRLASIYNYFF